MPEHATDQIAVAKCPNCGYVYGDDLDYRFPNPSECLKCGAETENTTVADPETVRSLADGGLRPDGGTVEADTERNAYIYEVDGKGVCQNCGYVASVVSHGHEPVERGCVEQGDDWVRCEIRDPDRDAPEVVTLCGSTRFKEAYEAERRRLTMDGKIVHTVGLFGHSDDVDLSENEKEMLDWLHKEKIDRSDRIHVINVGGYIGDSTQSEIEYARENGKKISWLEPRKTRSLSTQGDQDV